MKKEGRCQSEGRRPPRSRSVQDGGEDDPEGPHPRQPWRAAPARRVRRRPPPQLEPATGGGPAARSAASYEMTPEQARNRVEEQFRAYQETLSNDRRQLLDRFTIVDAARKVVGVGSVGTRASSPCSKAATTTIPCSSRSRKRRLGPRGPPAEEPLAPRAPCRRRTAVDAGGLRHLPGLDQRGPKPTGTTTGASCAT